MTYEPKSEHRFTFGLWTVGNPGRDPFGEPVREQLSPVAVRRAPRRGRRVGRQLPRQRPGADRRQRRTSATRSSATSRRRSTRPACVVPMATTNLFRDPVFNDGAFTANDPEVRAYALQKTMRAIDLGVELGATTYVFWGGREGVETDAAKDPLDAIKRFRDAINFLCEYVKDQGYDLRFALEPKPNEPRGDIYFAHDGRDLAFIATLDHPRDGGRQPRGRARAHGRAELRAPRRAGLDPWASCSTSISTTRSRAATTRTSASARRTSRRRSSS